MSLKVWSKWILALWNRREPKPSYCRKHYFGVGEDGACPDCGIIVKVHPARWL